MPIIDHFSFLAPIYDRIIKPKAPDRFIKLLDLPTDGSLLDAGGGTGRIAQTLADCARRVVIADESLHMLSKAQSKNGMLVTCSHTELLPFPSESFERVIMVDALHHVGDQRKTAEELWRVLKPGGRLLIEEPDIRNLSIKLVAIAEKLAIMRSHFLSPLEIRDLFSHSNARVEIENEGYNAWVVVQKL